MNIFQKTINKKLPKSRVRGNKFEYTLSFENTKLDWYTSAALNVYAISKDNDLGFFSDSSGTDKHGTIVSINVMFDGKPFFSDTEIEFHKALDSDVVIRGRMLKALASYHNPKDGKWSYHDVSVLDNPHFYTLRVLGKQEYPQPERNLSTYDIVLPRKNHILVFRAVLNAENFNQWTLDDLDTIAKSIVVNF
jgi:hypothetical protein